MKFHGLFFLLLAAALLPWASAKAEQAGASCGNNSYKCTGYMGCFKYTSDCGERQAAVKPECCCMGEAVSQAEDDGFKYLGSFGQEGWCNANCRDLCEQQAEKQSMTLVSYQCLGCTKGSCPKYVAGYSQREWDGLSDSTKQFFNQTGRNAGGKSSGTALCPSGDEDCFCRFTSGSTKVAPTKSSETQSGKAAAQKDNAVVYKNEPAVTVTRTTSASKTVPSSGSGTDTLALNAGQSVSSLEGLGASCGDNSYRCSGYLGCFKYTSDCGQDHPGVKPACCCLDQVVAKAESNGWKYVGSFGQEPWCTANCSDMCRKEAAKSGLPLKAARCMGCTKGSCPKYVVGYSQQQWDGLSDSTKDMLNQLGRNPNGKGTGAALCPSGDEDCFCQF